MMANSDSFKVLLIDDDEAEKTTISRILKALTPESFRLDHVLKCSDAITLMQQQPYDLVLLDNRLSERISAKFSVPIIKATHKTTPIAIISNDVSPDYLQNTETLDVDYIIDKSNMVEFLRAQLPRLLGVKNG